MSKKPRQRQDEVTRVQIMTFLYSGGQVSSVTRWEKDLSGQSDEDFILWMAAIISMNRAPAADVPEGFPPEQDLSEMDYADWGIAFKQGYTPAQALRAYARTGYPFSEEQ